MTWPLERFANGRRKGYQPRGSGVLTGGGGPRKFFFKPQPTNIFEDISLGEDPSRLREHIPDFEPGLDYTQRELTLLAEKILLEDSKPWSEEPVILNANSIKHRLRHEIYCANGVPDPSIESGLYWRTHPTGRSFHDSPYGRMTKGFYK